MKLALVGVVFWLALAGVAHAQSPRAGGPAPGDDPSSRVAVDLGITGNLARGFTDRDLVSARGVIQAWSGKWGFYTQPYWLYGRVNLGPVIGKITTDDEIYVRTGLFRTLTKPLFAYGVTVFDHSLRRKIEARNLAGAGLGATLWQCQGSSLLTSVGVLHEITDYGHGKVDEPLLDDGTVGDTRQTVHWSVRIYGRYKLAGGKLNLLHDLIVVPTFSHPTDDYRILFYGALDAPIAKGFSARIQADATREGLIVAGTKTDDLVITFGVAYKNEWPPKPPPPPPTK